MCWGHFRTDDARKGQWAFWQYCYTFRIFCLFLKISQHLPLPPWLAFFLLPSPFFVCCAFCIPRVGESEPLIVWGQRWWRQQTESCPLTSLSAGSFQKDFTEEKKKNTKIKGQLWCIMQMFLWRHKCAISPHTPQALLPCWHHAIKGFLSTNIPPPHSCAWEVTIPQLIHHLSAFFFKAHL